MSVRVNLVTVAEPVDRASPGRRPARTPEEVVGAREHVVHAVHPAETRRAAVTPSRAGVPPNTNAFSM